MDHFCRLDYSTNILPDVEIMSISTLIIKPTKACNADCSYCSAPPEDNAKWTLDTFKYVIDKIYPYLSDNVLLLIHGGEPLLMGPNFYLEAKAYTASLEKNFNFSLQSNLLSYKTETWKKVMVEVFEGSISTSFEPGEASRTIKGSNDKYVEKFNGSISAMHKDGLYPLIIATIGKQDPGTAKRIYNYCASFSPELPFRLNFRYPAGRNADEDAISPETFTEVLEEVYQMWIADGQPMYAVPFSNLIEINSGRRFAQCPWTSNCGGRFLEIEPNGDVYNCGQFADLKDETYRFGNIFKQDMKSIMSSLAINKIKRRKVNLPKDCLSCEFLKDCQGGCTRDAVMFDGDPYAKFRYCHTWKRLFTLAKEYNSNPKDLYG